MDLRFYANTFYVWTVGFGFCTYFYFFVSTTVFLTASFDVIFATIGTFF
jgi:hypothetical protein